MTRAPTLTTDRLLLRPWGPADAEELAERIDDPEIAARTLTIPHPYSVDDAHGYIQSRSERYAAGEDVSFAITERESGRVVGGISLDREPSRREAELGYWLARDRWGRGYATEAARAVVDFGFSALELIRVTAYHQPGNHASARVLEKCGLVREGLLRNWTWKGGQAGDSVVRGIIRADWEARTQGDA